MEISEEITCIVCMNYFKSPVSLTCGHSFCKECIQLHLEERPFCPVCKYPSFNVDLPVNITLQNIVQNFKKKRPEEFQDEEEEPTQIKEDKPALEDPVIKEELKPSIVLRSRRARNTLFPGTMYRVEMDFTGSEDFFMFLVQNKNFVLARSDLKNNLELINGALCTRFDFVKVEKFKPTTVVILAMAREFVTLDKLDTLKYGAGQVSGENGREGGIGEAGEMGERRQRMLNRLKQTRFNKEVSGSIEFCYYKKADFTLNGEFSLESQFGKSLLLLYQKVNFFLAKLKKSNPQVFFLMMVRHQLNYGIDNILTTQVRLNMIESKRFTKDDPAVRNVRVKGIQLDIFKDPKSFGYLLCMLLNFDDATFKSLGAYKSLNLVFKKSFHLMTKAKDNTSPIFLFKIGQTGSDSKISQIVSENKWMIVAVLIVALSFYLSGAWN